jgi:uncharacterized protein
MNDDVAVILFLRCPKPGQVKSRLAKSIGNDLACEVYEQCAIRILQSVLSIPDRYNCFVFYSVSDEKDEVKEWLNLHGCIDSVAGCQAQLVCQLQSDCLGDRLVDAFEHVSKLGYRMIAVLGTDIPDLNAETLQRGIEALNRIGSDKCALLGPSIDGGFYMMILASNNPNSISEGLHLGAVEWSTSTVYENTSKALVANGYRVLSRAEAGLPDLRDFDELEDLIEWHQDLHQTQSEESFERLIARIISQT